MGNPTFPVRTSAETLLLKGKWILLENADYRRLKTSLEKFISNSCNDFFIYSEVKIIEDEFIKKSIVIL